MAHSGGHSKGHLGGMLLKLIAAAGSGGGGSSATGLSGGAEGDVGGAIGDAGEDIPSTTANAGGAISGNSRMGGGSVRAKPPTNLDVPVSTNGSYTPGVSVPSLSKPNFFERLLDPASVSAYYQGQNQLANTALAGQQAQALSAQQAQQELTRQSAAAALQKDSAFRDNTIQLAAKMNVPLANQDDLTNFAATIYHPAVLNASAGQGVQATNTATQQSIANTQLASANSPGGQQAIDTGFKSEQLAPFANILAKAPVTGVGQNIDVNLPGLGDFRQTGALPAGQTTSSKKIGPNGQVFENNVTTTSPPYTAGGGGFSQPIKLPSYDEFQQSLQQNNTNTPATKSQPGIGGGNTSMLAKPPIIPSGVPNFITPNANGVVMMPQGQIQIQQMIQQLQNMAGNPDQQQKQQQPYNVYNPFNTYSP